MDSVAVLTEQFHRAHDLAYGFASPGEPIEVVSLRLGAQGLLSKPNIPRVARKEAEPVPIAVRQTYFDTKWHATPVYRRDQLFPAEHLTGPVIVEQLDTTVVIHPGDVVHVDDWGNLVMDIKGESAR